MQFNFKYFKYPALAIIGASALYVAAVGLLSDVNVSPYAPEPVANDASEKDRAIIMAEGVVHAIEQELDESLFGWLPNDLVLVPNLIDNKTAYQRGVIYATRPASDMVSKTIARIGERDTIDSRLADATSRYFTYGEGVWGFWFISDCEGKYKAGIKGWRDWANSVGTGPKGGIYNMKSDDVYNILKYCAAMTDFALGNLNNTDIGHFQSDDNIYFAKGVSKVAGNVFRALIAVDKSVADRGGAENVEEALKRFAYIDEFNPIYVFAGGNAIGDAMMPNHVAALARHLDVVNNRLNDMLSSMEK